MWEYILAATLSFSAQIRAPRNDNETLQYQFSYQIENKTDNTHLFIMQGIETANDVLFLDMRGKFDYNSNKLLFKLDYQQVGGKEIHQYTQDLRVKFNDFSIGTAIVWNVPNFMKLTPSFGYKKIIDSDKWEIQTDSDLYITEIISYQTDLNVKYKINENVAIGVIGNYVKTETNENYTGMFQVTLSR